MDEILMLQEEISKLQASFADELVSESLDSEAADQLALQSTLTVLAERMATIRMKASGKRQLLEVHAAFKLFIYVYVHLLLNIAFTLLIMQSAAYT